MDIAQLAAQEYERLQHNVELWFEHDSETYDHLRQFMQSHGRTVVPLNAAASKEIQKIIHSNIANEMYRWSKEQKALRDNFLSDINWNDLEDVNWTCMAIDWYQWFLEEKEYN